MSLFAPISGIGEVGFSSRYSTYGRSSLILPNLLPFSLTGTVGTAVARTPHRKRKRFTVPQLWPSIHYPPPLIDAASRPPPRMMFHKPRPSRSGRGGSLPTQHGFSNHVPCCVVFCHSPHPVTSGVISTSLFACVVYAHTYSPLGEFPLLNFISTILIHAPKVTFVPNARAVRSNCVAFKDDTE